MNDRQYIRVNKREVVLTASVLIPPNENVVVSILPDEEMTMALRFESAPNAKPQLNLQVDEKSVMHATLVFQNWGGPQDTATSDPFHIGSDSKNRKLYLMCRVRTIGPVYSVFLQFMREVNV